MSSSTGRGALRATTAPTAWGAEDGPCSDPGVVGGAAGGGVAAAPRACVPCTAGSTATRVPSTRGGSMGDTPPLACAPGEGVRPAWAQAARDSEEARASTNGDMMPPGCWPAGDVPRWSGPGACAVCTPAWCKACACPPPAAPEPVSLYSVRRSCFSASESMWKELRSTVSRPGSRKVSTVPSAPGAGPAPASAATPGLESPITPQQGAPGEASPGLAAGCPCPTGMGMRALSMPAADHDAAAPPPAGVPLEPCLPTMAAAGPVRTRAYTSRYRPPGPAPPPAPSSPRPRFFLGTSGGFCTMTRSARLATPAAKEGPDRPPEGLPRSRDVSLKATRWPRSARSMGVSVSAWRSSTRSTSTAGEKEPATARRGCGRTVLFHTCSLRGGWVSRRQGTISSTRCITPMPPQMGTSARTTRTPATVKAAAASGAAASAAATASATAGASEWMAWHCPESVCTRPVARSCDAGSTPTATWARSISRSTSSLGGGAPGPWSARLSAEPTGAKTVTPHAAARAILSIA
mmetsp:Transcript_18854/g.50703  ORF Transcript_18854/g.50703 Transcript_18854/m.50703 type:complete len:521 (+) Transcript_18854:1019-2581(+)